MQKDKENKLDFPKSFLWGASVSAHQVEGGNHNQWTVWELESAKNKAKQAKAELGMLDNWAEIRGQAEDPENYVSGDLADHYNRYLEDFDFIERMNLNAFRFSVEWSRVEPEEGCWNLEVIKHYKDYTNELRRRGIEPIVTLFHFTLPVWFSDMGGFERRSNVKLFTRFAKKIIRELGSSVRFIVTLNEPEIYAIKSYHSGGWPPGLNDNIKFWRVLNNLAYAHRQVAREIHKLGRRYKVSISKNSKYYYAGDDALLSKISAVFMQYIQDDYFTKKVIKHCDFLGVNYYFTSRIYGYRTHNPNDDLSDIGWDLQPGDIQLVLERLYKKYNLPIIITENGIADSNDAKRRWWISQTISGIHKAIRNGAKVDGYLHWSLMDNFEWAYGKWPKFGLVEIDYETGGRKLRPSGAWYGKLIGKIRKV